MTQRENRETLSRSSCGGVKTTPDVQIELCDGRRLHHAGSSHKHVGVVSINNRVAFYTNHSGAEQTWTRTWTRTWCLQVSLRSGEKQLFYFRDLNVSFLLPQIFNVQLNTSDVTVSKLNDIFRRFLQVPENTANTWQRPV